MATSPVPARKYVRSVSPRLRRLLYFVFGLAALLGANSIYLALVTFQEWWTGQTYQNYFYQCMFLGHLIIGLIFLAPFLVFGVLHMLASWNRRNRRAVRIGYALFIVCIVLLASGLLLMRVGAFDIKEPFTRSVIYWLHVISPLAAIWLYWLHRLAGPKLKWRVGLGYAGAVTVVVGLLIVFLSQDPRQWNVEGSPEGAKYFEPSLARTASGNFISARALMNEKYCLKCHEDSYKGWFHSAHRFASFNNPAYLVSVREARAVALKRDGSIRAARWCAGCHDPAPFFTGAFDDEHFDDVNDPTAHAGITCTACHAITHVNSTRGNADYTIEEPLQYPFTYSDNPILQFINQQLVKAKPAFHKKTFLKPFHKTAEFCSACHKVHLPKALTAYKDFLRAQNHYDSYLLSGVSGHGARSFYYPKVAETDCNKCHMPLQPSNDFSAQHFYGAKELSIHDHLFPSANTPIGYFNHWPDVVKAHQDFEKGVMRVDIFGLKEDGAVDGKLLAPLRPLAPALQPGRTYLLEAVIRTLKMGHHFTQGTTDSNEIWLETTVFSGDPNNGGRVIAHSGHLDERGAVDPAAHFVNTFMLDRHGNRIDRRNAADIFTPLYSHQIPPGAGQVAHYQLVVPPDATQPLTVRVKLLYRKFDQTFMNIIAQRARPGDLPLRGKIVDGQYVNELPIMTMAEDEITFAIAGGVEVEENQRKTPIAWQRWNDYGIGLLLKGKAELRQAEEAFQEVEKLGRYDGPLNLARVYFREGRLDDATAALARAAAHKNPPAPAWTLSWLSGVVNRQQGYLREAEKNFRSVLEDRTPEMIRRKFDFSKDYVVINLLGVTLFDRAKQVRTAAREQERKALLQAAVEQFHRTLALDAENLTAHYNLQLLYGQLGQQDLAKKHGELHQRYKPDDTAAGQAVAIARRQYPEANHAAEAVVIYQLSTSAIPAPALEPAAESDQESSPHGEEQ